MESAGDLTVGEVLSLLQEDFPEATLGRLREFEDLGLVSPELGPSGHRRYPQQALGRLRRILERMRDGYDAADLVDRVDDPSEPESESSHPPVAETRVTGSAAVIRRVPEGESTEPPTLFDTADDSGSDEARSEATGEQPSAADDTAAHPVAVVDSEPTARSDSSRPLRAVRPDAVDAGADDDEPSAVMPGEVTPDTDGPAVPEPSAAEAVSGADRRARVEAVSALQEAPAAERTVRPRPSRTRDLPSSVEATKLLARAEFLERVGLDDDALSDMESFGVISPVTIGGTSSYDASALRVGGLVASLLELGYEPRHLRMFRISAEREVDLLRQMALPLLMQRNPVGREQAKAQIERAADLGAELRAALVDESVNELIDHAASRLGAEENGGRTPG